MRAHDPGRESSMLALTAGIGGMVLGFGVYKLTHFAPAILLGVVLSVVFTMLVTHESR